MANDESPERSSFLDLEGVHSLLQCMKERLDIYPQVEDFPVLSVEVGELLLYIMEELEKHGALAVTPHYECKGVDEPCVEVYGGVATQLVAGTRVRAHRGSGPRRRPHVSPTVSPVFGPVAVTEPSERETSTVSQVVDETPKPTDKDIRIRLRGESFDLCRTVVEAFVHHYFVEAVSLGDRRPFLPKDQVRRFYFQKSVVVPGSFSLISLGNGVNNVDLEFVYSMPRPYFDDAHSAVVPLPISLLREGYDSWFQTKIEYYSQAGDADHMWDLYERRILLIRNPETVTNGLSLYCHSITQKGFQPPVDGRRHVSLVLCRSFFGEFQTLRRSGRDPLSWVKSFMMWHYPNPLDAYSFLAQMVVELATNLMKEEFPQVSRELVPFFCMCLVESVKKAIGLEDKRSTVLALTGLIQGTLFLEKWCSLSMSDIRTFSRAEESLGEKTSTESAEDTIESPEGSPSRSQQVNAFQDGNNYDETTVCLGEFSPQCEARMQGYQSVSGAARIAREYNRRNSSKSLSEEFDDLSLGPSQAAVIATTKKKLGDVESAVEEEDGDDEDDVDIPSDSNSVEEEEASKSRRCHSEKRTPPRSDRSERTDISSAEEGPSDLDSDDDGEDGELAHDRATCNIDLLMKRVYEYMSSLLDSSCVMFEGIIEVVLREFTDSLLAQISDKISDTLYRIMLAAVEKGHAEEIMQWFDAVSSKDLRDDVPCSLYSFLEKEQCEKLMAKLLQSGLEVTGGEKKEEGGTATVQEPILEAPEPPKATWRPSEPIKRSRGSRRGHHRGHGKGKRGQKPPIEPPLFLLGAAREQPQPSTSSEHHVALNDVIAQAPQQQHQQREGSKEKEHQPKASKHRGRSRTPRAKGAAKQSSSNIVADASSTGK